jgi:hypothetical protein
VGGRETCPEQALISNLSGLFCFHAVSLLETISSCNVRPADSAARVSRLAWKTRYLGNRLLEIAMQLMVGTRESQLGGN